jgi:hypothetical protein
MSVKLFRSGPIAHCQPPALPSFPLERGCRQIMSCSKASISYNPSPKTDKNPRTVQLNCSFPLEGIVGVFAENELMQKRFESC